MHKVEKPPVRRLATSYKTMVAQGQRNCNRRKDTCLSWQEVAALCQGKSYRASSKETFVRSSLQAVINGLDLKWEHCLMQMTDFPSLCHPSFVQSHFRLWSIALRYFRYFYQELAMRGKIEILRPFHVSRHAQKRSTNTLLWCSNSEVEFVDDTFTKCLHNSLLFHYTSPESYLRTLSRLMTLAKLKVRQKVSMHSTKKQITELQSMCVGTSFEGRPEIALDLNSVHVQCSVQILCGGHIWSWQATDLFLPVEVPH